MKNRRFLLMTMLFLIMILSFTLAACQQQETPNNNEAIKVIAGVGTLKIDLEMKEPTADSSTYVSIKDSQAAIFDYDNWEPGYMDVKVLRISNKGSLALKWYAKFVSDYELSQLTNVIDVYVKLSATDITVNSRAEVMANWQKVGTVKDFVNTIETVMDNTLATSESQYLGIALTMQVDAGLEYNISLGGDFDILILATQQTAENDDVNDQYDKDAEFDEFVVRNVSTEAQLADVLSDTTKESPVVVNLKSDITVNTTINVVGDVTINLDKNTIVTSESVARPFNMTSYSSLTINNMANAQDIVVGAYGLVNIGNVQNVDVTINGGSYVGNLDNGAFIKVREGADNVDIRLNDVTYVDNGNDSFVMNMNGVDEYATINVTVIGGSYTSFAGFQVVGAGIASFSNLNTVVSNGVAFEIARATALIENSSISVGNVIVSTAPATCVAVSFNGKATVTGCALSGPTAYYVYSSGGKITASENNATNCDIEYKFSTNTTNYPDAVYEIYINGAKYTPN